MDEAIIKDINKSFLRDVGNGIMLSSNEIDILNRYGIDYKSCMSVSELIFKIENYLNEIEDSVDLDELSIRLSEFNYYSNINK